MKQAVREELSQQIVEIPTFSLLLSKRRNHVRLHLQKRKNRIRLLAMTKDVTQCHQFDSVSVVSLCYIFIYRGNVHRMKNISLHLIQVVTVTAVAINTEFFQDSEHLDFYSSIYHVSLKDERSLIIMLQ